MGWGIAGGQDLTVAPLEDVAGGVGGGKGLSHVPYISRCIRIIIMAELGKDHPKSGGPGVDIRGKCVRDVGCGRGREIRENGGEEDRLLCSWNRGESGD